MDDITSIVSRLSEDLLKRLKVDGLTEVRRSQDESTIVVNLVTQDAALMIGMGGETLDAFQSILRSLVQKETGEFTSLTVDVEGYRQRRAESLESLAVNIATRVKGTGQPEALKPMTAFERRVVHSKIQEMDGVISESIGESRDRHIVIKPIMRDIR